MKVSKLTIVVLALTLLTLLTWVVYQINRLQKSEVAFEEVDSKYTQELRPDFNPQILERLEKRRN